MKWLKKLFKKLSSKSTSKTALRDKVVEMYGEMYGEEAGEAYDKINTGIPIGGFLEMAIFLQIVEEAKKALGEK